ncbi:MAG: hypothetical protein ABIG93_04530 [archaeon]|nr:hypothetical protein [Nanoarchaeota archaeon]
MKKFEFEQGDMYISEERLIEGLDVDGIESHLEKRLDELFYSRPLFREYIDLYGRLNNLPKMALLEAHGDTNGDWVFYDGQNGEIEQPVQKLITRNDGKYSALLLAICNPGMHTPKSRKSILVVPDTTINWGLSTDHEIIFDLIVPRIGELDSYTIDYELEQLKKKLSK